MSTATMTAAETANDMPQPLAYLQAVAERLSAVLLEETALLRQQDVQAVEPLQENKQKLCRAYEEQLANLQQQPELVTKMASADRDQLRSVLHQLQQHLHENRQALRAARDARRYVLKAIREAALGQQQSLQAYSPKGNARHNVFRNTAGSAAVAYNQQL